MDTEEVAWGGDDERRARRRRPSARIVIPALALTVLVAGAVALGVSGANDDDAPAASDGIVAEPRTRAVPTNSAISSAPVVTPTTVEAVPLIVPSDTASVEYALQAVTDAMLQVPDGEFEEVDAASRFPGYCNYRLVLNTRTIELYWKGALPDEVAGAMPQSRRELQISVVRRPVAHSEADLRAATDAISDDGVRALKGFGRGSRALTIESLDTFGEQTCDGIRVEYSTKDGAKPDRSQVTPAQVQRALAKLTKGVPVRVKPVVGEGEGDDCGNSSYCLPGLLVTGD